MSDSVVLQTGGGVGIITLNRPEVLNACNVELKATLLEALRMVADDSAVRAVVLTGAGGGFCGGQDLREHAATLDAGDDAPMRTVTEHYNPIVRALVELPKPVIAAVNGVAAGAGASFALAADLRVAAESASFVMAFASVGLSLDSGASWSLQRVVGQARAMALCLLAEPVTADQALEMGLVNAVVPDGDLLEAALSLANRLAAGPTAAYAAIKESIHGAAAGTLAEALDHEATLQDRVARTDDHRNAVRSFLVKEQPTFTGH